MKTLISICLITLLFSSCQPKDLPTILDIHEDYAAVKISHMTTKSELELIKSKLSSTANIQFEFNQSDFFENGNIQSLKMSIVTPEGAKGSGSADLMTLQYKYYGFEYNPKGNPSIRIGVL